MGWGRLAPDQRVTPARQALKRFASFQQRLARVEEGRSRGDPNQRIVVPLGMMAATASMMLIFWMASLPWAWTLEQRLLHLAAAPSCDFARRAGLAPARYGEPGYHSRHDFDNDGIACKPLAPGQIVILVPINTIAASVVRDRMRGASGDEVEP